jgi:hypothetical protein
LLSSSLCDSLALISFHFPSIHSILNFFLRVSLFLSRLCSL